MLRRWLEAMAIVAFACLVLLGGNEVRRATLAQEFGQRAAHERPTNEPSRDARRKEGDTRDDWLKPTDWLLAIFTLLLAVYTGKLYQATAGLRETAEQQRADMLQSVRVAEKAASAAQASAQAAVDSVQIAKDFVERGYVFGGCGLGANTGDESEGLTKTVVATQGNYGKTPVFVEKLFLEQCHESRLPAKPVYKNRMVVNEPLPPDGKARPVNAKDATKIFPRTNGQMFYGRFIYLDVFKTRHYSSFIYRFFRDGTHLPADDVDPEFWAWGEYDGQDHAGVEACSDGVTKSDDLIFERAPVVRNPAECLEEYQIFANGVLVGHIYLSVESPIRPWMWVLADEHREDRTPTQGYRPTREAAMAAFAKCWRRE
jgi:hypothetical protein